MKDFFKIECEYKLEYEPVANVAEMVRCKYCKYGCEEPNNMVYCPQYAGGLISEDSFCSMWKKKKR